MLYHLCALFTKGHKIACRRKHKYQYQSLRGHKNQIRVKNYYIFVSNDQNSSTTYCCYSIFYSLHHFTAYLNVIDKIL